MVEIIWFLAPTVSLCVQQHEVISAQLPAIQTRQLTGADQVDRWGSQLIWDSALKGVRVVISTHAVLCDALTHGFVRMEQLALIVFDEAHHCTKRHPGNRIMRDFYHPMHLEEQHVPHILGLTASPIMRSNVGEIRKIESNLNAITRTPQKERKELMCYVHRPAIIKLPFQHNTTSSSKCLLLLASFLQESVTDKGRQALEKFYRQTCVMSVDLGPWAADFFVTTAVRQLSKEVKQERSIGNYFLDPLKTTLMDLLSGLLNVSPVPLISSNISDRVRRLLGFLQLENEKDFSGIIFVRERVKAYVLTELLSQHPETRGRFRSAPFVGESNGGKDAYSFWEKNTAWIEISFTI
ncbi:hypothetical protein VI817_000124 [Penicillium citrinum]|nr:hypothetical protein VI817_000124 [Penicillium citrinum]